MIESPTTSAPGCPNCIRLERERHRLPEEVAERRRQIGRNSGNSSLPPSANPPWAPRPVPKKPSGRRPGGQPGHRGHFRKLLPLDQRAICWAHRKRDFQQCLERGGASEAIGQAGLSLCKSVSRPWHRFRSRRLGRESLRRRIEPLRATMRKWLEQAVRLQVKGTSGFCREVLEVGPALWTFATARGIEPTNNHAERIGLRPPRRMFRPAVMWRKQGLGSHRVGGCRFVERMMTVLQTLRLKGRSVMDYLTEAVRALRCGLSPPALAS